MDTLIIMGDAVEARASEGAQAQIPVEAFMQRAGPPLLPGLERVVWPDGMRHVFVDWPMAVVLVERPPQVLNVRWIRADSPSRAGPGTTYAQYRLAFPYTLFAITFAVRDVALGLRLTQRCEVYFRQEPLRSLEDELLFPCLLNASKHRYDDRTVPYDAEDPRACAIPAKCVSWLCSQHLPLRPLDRLAEPERIRRSITALLEHTFHSGFNLSSDSGLWPGEEASWHTISVQQRIDSRIVTPERWQAATDKDPQFILDVPFLPSGFSAREICQRLFTEFNAKRPPLRNSTDLARLVFSDGAATRLSYPHRLWPTEV